MEEMTTSLAPVSMVTGVSPWCWECYYRTWQYKAYINLMVYVPPVLLLLGTVGNVLNLVVLQSRQYRSSTSTVSLSALAVMDILVLWTGLLRQWILVSTKTLYLFY